MGGEGTNAVEGYFMGTISEKNKQHGILPRPDCT